MLEGKMAVVKSFEDALKNIILEEYGRYLVFEKVNLLKYTSYTTPALVEGREEPEIRGEMTRMMLDNLMNLKCMKAVTVDDGSKITMPYGALLQQIIIEYLTQKLAKKYGYQVDELKDKNGNPLGLIGEQINTALGGKLLENVFWQNAVTFLSDPALSEFRALFDEDSIEIYFAKMAGPTEELTDPDKENQFIQSNFENGDAVKIIQNGLEKFIRFRDRFGKNHITRIALQGSPAEAFYYKKMREMQPGEKLDAEEFYEELRKISGEIELTPSNEVNKDNLSEEENDMFKFVDRSQQVREAAEDEEVTHSSDMSIHVVEKNDQILFSNPDDGQIKVDALNDGEDATVSIEQDIANEVISKEEYEDLNRRYYQENEQLSPVDLDRLNKAIEVYGKIDPPAVLKPGKSGGFAIKTFALYFVLLAILIVSVIAIVLYK